MTRIPSRAFVLALALALPAAAESEKRSAPSSNPDNSLLDEARRAFAEGRAFMDEHRYREAMEKFRMAAQVKETPGLRYYIAFCLEQLGELLEAQREYSRSAELLAEFEANDVRELLPEAQERVDRALPILTIVDVQGGETVRVDGSVVRPDETIRVNPGKHTVTILFGDHSTGEASIELSRGQTERFSAARVRGDAPAATPAEADTKIDSDASGRSRAKPIVVWSGVGLAAVGVGVGLGGFFLRTGAKDEASALAETIRDDTGTSNACSSSGVGHPDCEELLSAGSRYDLGNALLVTGIATAAVGVSGALLGHFLWPKSKVQVGGVVSPTLNLVSLSGRF